MDGGCLSLWPGKALSEEDKQFILRYTSYLSSTHSQFTVRFKKIMLTDKYSHNQLMEIFNYIPNEEIIVCGWAEDIFNASEAILKEFGGYFPWGFRVNKKEFKSIHGKWCRLMKRHKYLPFIPVKDMVIIDWEFIKNYFNRTTDEETRQYFSIDRFKKLERIQPTPN